jgi:hypothetical protein
MKLKYVLIIAITLMILLVGCSNIDEKLASSTGNVVQTENMISDTIEKIEIYHFHGTHQCSSCIAVGQLAEETVNTYFADEVKSGKIVFGHINIDLPENKLLAGAYGVTGSSLWIGTYTKDGKFSSEENVKVWYKINDKPAYMDHLKGIIGQKLAGN